jgi:hypothetical protein
VDTLIANGVERVLGLRGDSLNGVTDAIRTRPFIPWMHFPVAVGRIKTLTWLAS